MTVLERLDMNVGRVLFHRLGEDRIDEANDRRVIVAVEEILLGEILREMRQVGLLIEALDRLHGFLAALVGALQEHDRIRLPRRARA